MQYQNLQVGGPFPPLRGAGECVAVNVDSSGILLAYNFNRPSAREIAAMGEAQPFEIRFVRISDILYVLTQMRQPQLDRRAVYSTPLPRRAPPADHQQLRRPRAHPDDGGCVVQHHQEFTHDWPRQSIFKGPKSRN
nr:MAG TPA: hypothetical protein [Caudoviricetes sp.]